jgi:hypothetical protein
MTATEEPTLYDVLEVDPASSLEERRAAVERARETYGQESLAVYALVDEDQLEELRAKLTRRPRCCSTARRASYDRSIGRIGPATLWAEDDQEDEALLPPVETGPHLRAEDLEFEPESESDEEPPAQQALALDVPERPALRPGRRLRGPAEAAQEVVSDAEKPAPLLSGDWAAAVPAREQRTKAAMEPGGQGATTSAPVEREVTPGVAFDAPERDVLPPALGLRLKPAPQAPSPEPAAVTAEPAAPPPLPAAPPRAAAASERPPELPARPRESRLKLDIPSDAEFNGELLRRVRESYGLSLQQVAERTRITASTWRTWRPTGTTGSPPRCTSGHPGEPGPRAPAGSGAVSKTYLLAAQRLHARPVRPWED